MQSACITLHDEAAIVRVTSAAWYALAWAGEIAAAGQTAQRGLDALEANVTTERCLLLALAGVSRSFSGRPGGEALFGQSMPMAMAEDLADDKVRAEVLHHFTVRLSVRGADLATGAATMARTETGQSCTNAPTR